MFYKSYLNVKKVSTETVALAMAWKVKRFNIFGKKVAIFSVINTMLIFV